MKCPNCNSKVLDYNPDMCGVHYDLDITNDQKFRREGNEICDECLSQEENNKVS